MDKVAVQGKLDDLSERLEWIKEDLPDSLKTLKDDRRTENLVLHNFCHAVQICIDIAQHALAQSGHKRPTTMSEAFDCVHEMGMISEATTDALKKSVHIRNIATHSYRRLDLGILYSACKDYLGSFHSFSQEITRSLERTTVGLNDSNSIGGR